MSDDAMIREFCDSGRYDEASTIAIEKYGPGVMGLLVWSLDDYDKGNDAFAIWAEELWKSMAKFEWRCPLSGWAYRLGRSARARVLRDGFNKRRHSFSDNQLDNAVARVRTVTEIYRRTQVKDRFRSLRSRFSVDEQDLLVLRGDRGLSWNEIADALSSDPASPDAAVTPGSLRVRYHRLKEKLRDLAQEEGLLDNPNSTCSP